MACSGLLFFLSAIIVQLSLTTAQQPQYRYHYCLDSDNYTANSAFPANLNLTLSSLIANAIHGDGFYNTSNGQSPDSAYGLFLCRGNISPGLCQSCIKVTSEEIISRCPNRKEAIIWYDECMLRYANRSIFANMEESPTKYLWNVNNISDPDRFNATVASLMNNLVKRVVSGSYSNMFTTGDVNFTYFYRIYGMVQCTPDISKLYCNRCLSASLGEIPKCCDGKRGGRVLKPSCNIRYETFLFYDPADATQAPFPPATSPPSPSPAPVPATSTNSTDNRSSTSRTVVIIVVPTIILLLASLVPTF